MLQAGVQTLLLDTIFNISSFGEDESGELYVVDLNGSIYRIRNPDATVTSAPSFSMLDGGSSSFASDGVVNQVTGYARIQAAGGSVLPAAMEILSSRQNGALVSETT